MISGTEVRQGSRTSRRQRAVLRATARHTRSEYVRNDRKPRMTACRGGRPSRRTPTIASTTTARSRSAWPARTTSAAGRSARSRSRRRSTTAPTGRRRTACSASASSGPEKDWECACGKYRGMKYKGMICDRCGVKVTHSRVRRKRHGPHRAGRPGRPHLVLQGDAQPPGHAAGHEDDQPGEDHLLPGLRRHRPGRDRRSRSSSS